jgi:hypothetical protein
MNGSFLISSAVGHNPLLVIVGRQHRVALRTKQISEDLLNLDIGALILSMSEN